jgi:hypothetical protein
LGSGAGEPAAKAAKATRRAMRRERLERSMLWLEVRLLLGWKAEAGV